LRPSAAAAGVHPELNTYIYTDIHLYIRILCLRFSGISIKFFPIGAGNLGCSGIF
jgi:hypothetical protein